MKKRLSLQCLRDGKFPRVVASDGRFAELMASLDPLRFSRQGLAAPAVAALTLPRKLAALFPSRGFDVRRLKDRLSFLVAKGNLRVDVSAFVDAGSTRIFNVGILLHYPAGRHFARMCVSPTLDASAPRKRL
jgi:hypothetical protein